MPNPFYFGGHVSPEQFIGRRSELQKILALLDVTHTQQLQSVSVVGPRRIGKSSLLFYLCHTSASHFINPSNYRLAYVDLHDPECHTRSGLLSKILRALHLSADKTQPVSLTEFQEKILEFKTAGGLPIVALDEFEELFARPDEFLADFYNAWRHLVNDNLLAFITASKLPLNDLTRNQPYTSPFFNVFTVLMLGKLTDAEADALIARGASSDRPFGQAEQELMRQLGESHPARLQLAGRAIYNAKSDNTPIDASEIEKEFYLQARSVGLEPPANS